MELFYCNLKTLFVTHFQQNICLYYLLKLHIIIIIIMVTLILVLI